MMAMLLADSDAETRAKIRREAEKRGFSVDEAPDGITAMKLLRRREYDVIIMDAYLPDLDGITVCRQLRKTSDAPVLFLTGLNKEYDRLAGFEAGADDYVLKPFYLSELFVRIQAILRRSRNIKKHGVMYVGGVSLDPYARAVFVEDDPVTLSPREYALLAYLMQNPNVALSREAILNHVWGEDFEGMDRTVDSHVKSLRKQLKPHGDCIVTLWGYGYKLVK